MKKAKTNTHECSPTYNIVLTKKVGCVKKGELLTRLDRNQLSNFLGKNGYPFGFSGHAGEINWTFRKEIMDNVIIEQIQSTVTEIKTIHKLEDFK